MQMRGGTPTNTTLVQKIWTPTDVGKTHPTMGKSGCRMSRKTGLRTAMAIGSMSPPTAGLGLVMSRGAGRHITMGAGCGTAARGRGGRDRYGAGVSIVRSGRPLMCRSSDLEVDGELVSDGADGAASDGCPLGPVIPSSRGGADMAGGSA